MGIPTPAAEIDLRCISEEGFSTPDFSRTIPVMPTQKTAGQSALMEGELLQSTQSPEVELSAPFAQGIEEVVAETAVAMPCIGRTTTKDSTSRAAKIR